MRFGVCVNLLPRSSPSGIEFASHIAQMGYDYIELPLGPLMELDDHEVQTVGRILNETGLPCWSCNDFIRKGMKLVGPDADPPAIRDYCVRALDRAALLGAGRVVLGSPWAKAVPEGFSRTQAWEQMLALCRFLGPEAQARGLTVVVEHNNRTETNFLNQLWEVDQLVQEADHPHLRAVVDYFHICTEDEPMDHITACGPRLSHVHFAKIHGRTYPCQLEEDDRYLPFLQALHQIGYDGGVSIEAHSPQFLSDGPAALSFFRRYF